MEKSFPLGTHDLYGHLGVHGHSEEHDTTGGESHSDSSVTQPHEVSYEALQEITEHQTTERQTNVEPEPAESVSVEPAKLVEHDKETNTFTVNVSSWSPAKVVKNGWPYAVIFAAGLFLYLVLFTSFSLADFFQRFSFHTSASKVETTASQIPSDQLAAYNSWIRSYFFDVSDPRILDPDYDISGNGLTNYQKFLLGLNPKKKDTLGLGMTDTQALIQGIDPLTGGPLTDAEKKIIAANIDLEAISNKLSLAAAGLAPKVAGAATSGLTAEVQINQNIPGEVDVPDLNISVPLIWTQDTNNFEHDLTQGVVHYPGTPMPGEVGTSYISGHSSNYIWIKSKYNNIFASLDKLPKFASFSITVTDVNGKKITFHYVAQDSGIFTADDQTQFASTGKSVVALSTCWPVGTSSKRLVVFGQLTQVDQ